MARAKCQWKFTNGIRRDCPPYKPVGRGPPGIYTTVDSRPAARRPANDVIKAVPFIVQQHLVPQQVNPQNEPTKQDRVTAHQKPLFSWFPFLPPRPSIAGPPTRVLSSVAWSDQLVLPWLCTLLASIPCWPLRSNQSDGNLTRVPRRGAERCVCMELNRHTAVASSTLVHIISTSPRDGG
jgi:hypothetical protein